MKISKRKIILIIAFCCIWSGIFAQNIKIYFPKFVGEKYVFVLHEGLKADTVQSGVIDKTGIANLTVPPKYKGCTGIGSWSVVNSGAIKFIVDENDFSITCKDSIPTPQNIFFKGSNENDILKRIEYSGIQKNLPVDSSYAAFFLRSLNYMKGLGNHVYSKTNDEKAYFEDFTHYLTYELDFKRLYFSGLWGPVISSTFKSPDKAVWAENMVKVLKRTESQRVFEALATDLVVIPEQYDWPEAEKIILAYLESSGRLTDDPSNIVNRAIRQSKIKLGDRAPELKGLEGKLTNTILIFYESGCSLCNRELSEINKRYPQLLEKKIRVVSVAIDEDRKVYEFHSKDSPWPDKLCDFKGFKSENLINYGVVGTPTIYYIDENGIIQDKQIRLDDIKGLNLR